MHLGKTTQALAAGDNPGHSARAAIRASVAPVVEALRDDLDLVLGSLTGPDPEYALYLLAQVLSDLPAATAEIEAALVRRHLKLAA